jgi:hypothetical protein
LQKIVIITSTPDWVITPIVQSGKVRWFCLWKWCFM